MRQNLEELQATQEESTRKSIEMEGLVEAINISSYVVEYNLDGTIQDINDNYLKLLNLTKDKVIGTHHSQNMKFTEQQQAEYDHFWRDLKFGKIIKEKNTINVGNKEFVFSETYTPIKNADGEVFKILKISSNLTGV
jgi:methyl-accepting chemotaxis protein